jgi:hypothetical protein
VAEPDPVPAAPGVTVATQVPAPRASDATTTVALVSTRSEQSGVRHKVTGVVAAPRDRDALLDRLRARAAKPA